MDVITICNLALSYLGDAATVSSIDPPEGSVQAEHCARFYPQALRSLLALHRWGFATRSGRLARLSAAQGFAFALPAGMVEMADVRDGAGRPLPFSLQDGRILAQQPEAWGVWTVSEVSADDFPPLFAEALAWQLAAMLSGALLKGDAGAAMAQRCLQMVSVYLPKAREADANQHRETTAHRVPWMEGR